MITLPYALQVIQPLKELVIQDEFDKIPEIKLNPNSDLSLISSNVASLSMTTDPTEDRSAQTATIFDSIGDYMVDNRNLMRLQTIEHMSKSFAVSLENSYSVLNTTIAQTVDGIIASLTTRYTELMVREKAETLIADDHIPAESDYTILDWGNLNNIGKRNEVIDVACYNAGIKNPEMSSLSLSYIKKKADFSSSFADTNIPDEVAEKVLAKLNEVFTGEGSIIDPQHVKQLWSIITSKNSYSGFCSLTMTKFDDNRNVVLNCLHFLEITEIFESICDGVPQLVVDELGENTYQSVLSNIETLGKTLFAIEYWLLAMKELVFDNKLILTKEILNGPIYEDFVGNGKSIVDVHNYLKAFYFDTTIPLNGISVDVVTSADTEERLTRSASKLLANATFIKSKCLIAAYEHAMRQFILNDEAKVMFPQANNRAFVPVFLKVAMAKASYLGGNIANVDKVVYDLIIETFYPNTLVATMYKYLGRNFDDLADNGDDITDSSIVESQCVAVIELLTDYLFESFVVDEYIDGAVNSI